MNNLPINWLYEPFTNLLDFQGGNQPPKSDFVYEHRNGYIRLLQIRDFGNKPVPTFVPCSAKLKICESEDILIGRYGASVGKILTGLSGAYNVAMIKIIIPKSLNRRYVYHLLKSPFFQNHITNSKRSAQDGFNRTDLDNIFLPIAPQRAQEQIAGLLDDFSAKYNSTSKLLEKVLKSLSDFKQVFYDLAIQKGFKNLAEDNLTENNWPEKTFEEVAQITAGITLGNKNKDIEMKEFLYLRVANVQDGFLDLAEVKTVNIPKKDFNKYLLLEGDVLMTEGGDRDKLGRGTIWNNEIKNCLHQNHIFKARVDKNILLPEFLDLYLKSKTAREYFYLNATQTVNLSSINLSTVKKLLIKIPPLTVQHSITKMNNEFIGRLNIIEDKLNSVKGQLENLLNDIYMNAFTGNIIQGANQERTPINLIKNELIALLTIAKKVMSKEIKKSTKKNSQLTPYKNLIAKLNELGGEALPNDLLTVSGLENNIDQFFDLLKEGAIKKDLTVPMGKYDLIKYKSK